ncbi:enoyl-CoA hydratase/isomerase family protein [Falsihalocynthiibacter sp. SS001]|uniref:enoyl-CoA hydratase/isomerase family protein n=1 Tax=Falsihalocynthiibacter sp. SS001 TaxID=3349698 RepID=UPI0036D257D9
MIETSSAKDIWTIRINRPEKANSLTSDMLEQLIDAVSRASDAKAMVITGRGDVFSAGADLNEARSGLATSPLWEKLSQAVAEHRGLTICALNGTVAGGAFGMTLACDLRVAVASAAFFYPVVKHGFLPQPSDPKRMEKLIGPARTKLVFVAGHKINSQTAYDYGLIDMIVEPEQLDPTVQALCESVGSAKIETVHAIKAMCP